MSTVRISNVTAKQFDLSVRKPKVLLVGNGLSRNMDWNTAVRQVIRPGFDLAPYYDMVDGNFTVPNPILTMIAAETTDNIRQSGYYQVFQNLSLNHSPQLPQLLSLSFDAILTTNYTYEFEKAVNSRYNGERDLQGKHFYVNKPDKKYLLRHFNRIPTAAGDEKDIWHIHGEQYRKSSLILSHDEYVRLLQRITDYVQNRGFEYQKYYQELKAKTWIDYLIMGDVYIVGFGLDYSEIDVWWLLNRKRRERAETGRTVFYEPVGEKSRLTKQKLLTDFGITVRTFDYQIDSKDKNKSYTEFYNMVIDDLKNELRKGKQ